MSVQWMLSALWRYHTTLAGHDGWTREQIEQHQRVALRRLLQLVSARSPFYRQLYQGIDLERAALADLPPVDKQTLMTHFDRAVTDHRLRLADLQRHLESADGDDLVLGRFFVLATSGSSGMRGVFPYTKAAVATYLAAGQRLAAQSPPRFTLPWRSAWVAGAMAAHGTYRTARLMNGWPFVSHVLPADLPLTQLVEGLNDVQPHSLMGYPGMLLLLAEAQMAGQLRISPRFVGYGGEVRPPGLSQALASAWPGVPAVETYAFTEIGMAGGSCPTCGTIHLFEDLGIFEVVDGCGKRVAPGETGQRLLLTNLVNPVLPLIRYEVTDLLTVAPEPNLCGRPWLAISAIDGRADELLYLPGRDGHPTPVSPSVFRNVLGGMAEVAEYQVVQEKAGLRIALVPRQGEPPPGLLQWVGDKVGRRLGELGIVLPVRVEQVESLARQNGKRKLVLRAEG